MERVKNIASPSIFWIFSMWFSLFKLRLTDMAIWLFAGVWLCSCSNVGIGRASMDALLASSTTDGATGGGYSSVYVDPFPVSEQKELISSLETFIIDYYRGRTKQRPIVASPDENVLVVDVSGLRKKLFPEANQWEQLHLDFQLSLGWLSDSPKIALRASGGSAGGIGNREPDQDYGYSPFDRSQDFRLTAYARNLLSLFNNWRGVKLEQN
jgi:hypothetical protein